MLEKYYRINQAVGIGINLLTDGSVEINACQVMVNNNRLTFEKKIPGLTDIGELKKHFSEKAYLAVNLNGKGVLHKQVELIEEINQNNFSKILTNANLDDFYIQNFISGQFSFISAVRKVDADKWIDQLKELNFTPLMLSLGPFPVQSVVGQLNIYNQDLVFHGHNVTRNEQGDWTGYKFDSKARSPFPIKVESEPLDEKLIIAYAAAFQLLMFSRVPVVQANVPELEEEFDSTISSKKFHFRGVLVLAIFFFLLLINFVLFSYLIDANSRLAAQVSSTAQSTIDIQSVNDQIKQKEGSLHEMGWENGINKSALVDQLASLVPEELSLSDIAVDPVDQANSRIQKTIVFFNRQIEVMGTSEKIIPVNEWIARLKTRQWVKNVQLNNYTFSNELNTGQFTVTINY